MNSLQCSSNQGTQIFLHDIRTSSVQVDGAGCPAPDFISVRIQDDGGCLCAASVNAEVVWS